MSRHLNLADQLVSLGRHYLQLGRDQEALQAFGRVARLDDVPQVLAEEAQAGLADIYLRRNKYRQARRHLHVALARDPGCARYHHLLAITLEEEDVRRAEWHYARAVELDPEIADYRADYGLFQLSLLRIEEGLTQLQRAVELAPEEPEYLRQLMRALLDAERGEEARRAILAGMFRYPRDHRFQALWREYHFWEAQRTQHRAQVQRRFRMNRPRLLPFKAKGKAMPRRSVAADGAILRLDAPHPGPRPRCPEHLKRRHRS